MIALANVLQFLGGIILSAGYIPQIIKTFKTKSVEDFSVKYYLLVFTGIVFFQIYAITNVVMLNAAHMFLITNTIAFLCSGTMLALTLKYRKK